MPKQTSIQLPEITRRQIYAIAIAWGITDQPYEAKARWISETIQIVMAKVSEEIKSEAKEQE